MAQDDRAILRLEVNVDAMRLQVMEALGSRQMELQAMVDAEVERTKLTLEATLRDAMRKGIDTAIRQAIENQMWRVRQAIEPGIGKAISEMLAKIEAVPLG